MYGNIDIIIIKEIYEFVCFFDLIEEMLDMFGWSFFKFVVFGIGVDEVIVFWWRFVLYLFNYNKIFDKIYLKVWKI